MITSKSQKMNIDDNLYNFDLKAHQRGLIYKALIIDNNCKCKNDVNYGIFTDPPGTGKTFVILSLIDLINKFESNFKNIFLIVVPNQLEKQWVSSIDSFYKEKYKVLELIDNETITKLYRDTTMLYEYTIFITTPILYISLVQSFNTTNFSFRCVFFDEIDIYQKNLSGRIKSQMNWFISASLKRLIHDNVTMLGSYSLNTHILLNNECCCDPGYVKKCMKVGKPDYHEFICYDIYIDDIFYKIYKNTEIMKSINAMNYSVLSKECGSINVYKSRDLLKSYYENILKLIENKKKDIEENEKNMRNLSQYEKNKKIETINKLVTERNFLINSKLIIKKECYEKKICIKCFEILSFSKEEYSLNKTNYYITPCENILCTNCIMEIIDKKYNDEYDNSKIIIDCLECEKHKKEELKSDVIQIINEDYLKWDKLYILSEILDLCNGKIILYNSSRHVLNDYLSNYYHDKETSFLELNGGNINDLTGVIEKFKSYNKLSLLFINDITLSNGLNLEFVDDVILTEKMESILFDQLIGRALRFPRKKKLTIYQLYNKNEY